MSAKPARRRRIWPYLVVIIILGGTGATLALRRQAVPKDIDSSLSTTVRRGELVIEVIETAKVQPRDKVEVKSKVAGQVAKVMVIEGQRVKKGQVLLRLDPTDSERDAARAEAEVAQAENALEFAQLTLARKQRAMDARGVSQAEIDLAQNDVKMRTVALRTAKVAREAALDRLRYTTIVSPLDGTVIQRGIEPGEVVTPGIQATFEGKPLLTVANLAELLVRAELNQIDVAKVKLAQSVTLTLDALPGKTYHAKVTKVAPASVAVKGKDVEVFPIEAMLTDADQDIKPGMTADIRVRIESRPNVLLLPIEALSKEKNKDQYMATRIIDVPGGKPRSEKLVVQVGARNDRDLEVTSGLKEGDKVLIKPPASTANEISQ